MADERNQLWWPESESDDDDADPGLDPFINRVKDDSVIIATLKKLVDDTKSASPSETLTLSPNLPSSYLQDRGTLAGILTYSYGDFRVDCSIVGSVGRLIPCDIDQVVDMHSDAALVILVVQKYSTYLRLLDSEYYNRFPCIVLYANGQPDVATRLFLRKMKLELKLPVLALVDSDPFSVKILKEYSDCGSNLDIKWVGLRPSDLDKYKIPEVSRLQMTEKDIKDAKDLLEDDFVKKNPGWVQELTLMLKSKQKVEIEALSHFGFIYLSEIFIPYKLQQQDWV